MHNIDVHVVNHTTHKPPVVKKLMEACKWSENRERKDTVPCKQARMISAG